MKTIYFQDLVDRLNEVQLWALVHADIVNGELQVVVHMRDPGREPSPSPEPDNPDPGDSDHESDPGPSNRVSDGCNCQNCRPMPTHHENKCCTRSERPCITTNLLFTQLVLDANVLDITMHYTEDVLVLEHLRNNENFQHTAFRQYLLWQHGRVIPSCCVLAIHSRYPSPKWNLHRFLTCLFVIQMYHFCLVS